MHGMLVSVFSFWVGTAWAVPTDPWTWDEVRFGGVVEQGFDNSCGLASLLTIMKMQFGDDRYDEHTLLKEYMDKASVEEIADAMKNGLSLLELEHLAKVFGYATAKRELSISELVHLATFVPPLVYLEVGQYRHFAVVRGVQGDTVLLADPSRGNVELSREQFLSEWKTLPRASNKDGVALIIVRKSGDFPQQLLQEPSDVVPASFIEMERRLTGR